MLHRVLTYARSLPLAWLLARTNPTTAAGLNPEDFNYGSALSQGPNCYSYAMGCSRTRLMPGWLAARRGDPLATGGGDTPAQRREMFVLDGLRPLTWARAKSLPSGSWIVSLHQHRDNDFHLRRLDRTGWSEKPGDFPVRGLQPRTAYGLLSAEADGRCYFFAGFYVVNPARLQEQRLA